ncbi:MAG: methyltransferase domain-containing protein [Nitrospira sp.]|nr:methyltransferase domain-containing protein [Nitrospira sp.]
MGSGVLQSVQTPGASPNSHCLRLLQRLGSSRSLEDPPSSLCVSYRPDGGLCPFHCRGRSLRITRLTLPHDVIGGGCASCINHAAVFLETTYCTRHDRHTMTYNLTKHHFLNLLESYQPSPYESFGQQDERFSVPMHHAMKCRDRLHVALRIGLRTLPSDRQTIVDLGPFPGSLLRLLRRIDYTKSAQLYGAGLMISQDFVNFMQHDIQANILTVDLDPVGGHFQTKGYSKEVPLPDHSTQLVFALEIIEHLTSPFHLLAEAYRVLRSGGHIILTTPNVTRIGNVFKLLIGRSPNDRLAPPGYKNPDDEWRPHAREYAMHELADMLRQTGFDIAESRYFLGEDTQDCRQTASQHGINWAKWPFYAVPHLRGSLLIVGKKP